MNFKKHKDVKRASYYVWFLGAKESKGLRGDEYVQPVLNYLLDNECELEPSKVTLQISSKGLKIIQILSIPRKSSKLNADQQLQLFAAKPDSAPSSVMKSEQVKHHIPHDSISWVYQEDDVICAILLLYNPITRCPVHIHAYRCDSIQTANNLRQQLQTLVDRPENQKKFREIESRLAAKGLLIPPPCIPNGFHNNSFDEDLPTNSHQHFDNHHHHHHHHDSKRSYQNNSPSASKTLNSDGRSTRTDGSDEINSEESTSSDLGYAIRSSNRNNNNNNYKLDSKSRDPFIRSPSKTKSGNKYNNNKNIIEDSESQHSNLYDSLAAELRAKLGNPNMGPLLLPPRDYDSQKSSDSMVKKSRTNKELTNNKLCPLTRSESSGKSSSGIGSDEALCGIDNNQQQQQPITRSYYFESSSPMKSRPSQQTYLVSDRENHHHHHHNHLHPFNREMNMKIGDGVVGDSSSDDEDHHQFHSIDCLDVDVEDFEEDVIFTTTAPVTKQNRPSKSRSKSTFDLVDHNNHNNNNNFDVLKMRPHTNVQHPAFYRQKHLFHPTTNMSHFRGGRDNNNEMSNTDNISSYNNMNKKKFSSSNPNLEPTSSSSQRIPLKEVNNKNNRQTTTNDKSTNNSMMLSSVTSVIGRREQRFNGGHTSNNNNNNSTPNSNNKNYLRNHNENISQKPMTTTKSTPKFYFADAEFSSSAKEQRHHYSRGRSMGCLDQVSDESNYGPMSLNFHQPIDMNDRSMSPPYYLIQQPPPSVSSRNIVPKNKDNNNNNKRLEQQPIEARERRSQSRDRRSFDQPFSRYSYIDMNDDFDHDSPMRFSAMTSNMLMIRKKR